MKEQKQKEWWSLDCWAGSAVLRLENAELYPTGVVKKS